MSIVMGWEPIFVRGFRQAVKLWTGGMAWEAISHLPEYDATAYGRGMFAAVEALNGWLDEARREARAWAVPSETIEALITSTRLPS